MATNVKGPFLMSRAALPAMRRAGGGSIINVGSVLESRHPDAPPTAPPKAEYPEPTLMMEPPPARRMREARHETSGRVL